MNVFLSAEWRKLINLTYEVDEKLLREYLPEGLAIDTHMNGKGHVSLVAFDFLNTRLRGMRLPFHVNFPEINLRFYVRYKGQIGVVFIKEFVPKRCIALVANRIYNEPYYCAPMRSITNIHDEETISQQYSINISDKNHFVNVLAKNKKVMHEMDSPEHYFKEHSWGFGKSHSGKTMCYFVEHAIWQNYPVEDFNIELDFEALYGKKWGFLNNQIPAYKAMAVGSAVKVYGAIKLLELDKILGQG